MKKIFGSNVLITGGLGLIGSNLARQLILEGANVTICDNLSSTCGGNKFNISDILSKVKIHYVDIRDKLEIEKLILGKDYIFNLAAQSSHMGSMLNPILDLETNVFALVSMLEACRKTNPDVKIIHASTRQIYGIPEYFPVNEMHPIRPTDVNGINKNAGEEYLKLYYKFHNLRFCSLRLSNTYGPGMRVKDAKQIFLGIWIRSILERKPLCVYGDGEQLRDFTYVSDCTNAFILSAYNNSSDGKIYNLGGNTSVSLKEVAEILVNSDYGGSYKLVPFPENQKLIDIGNYYADTKKIRTELDWESKTSLKEGILKTLCFYDKNRSKYW